MFRYAGLSLTIDSELELPEFSTGHHDAGQDDPDVTIRLGCVPDTSDLSSADDEVVSRPAARFRIRNGSEIVVDASSSADAGEVRAALLGKVMAYLMRQRGYLPLHASAVAIDGRAVLFLGQSGAGKSTTAAAFYARGHQVTGDDLGAVRPAAGHVEVCSVWSGLRLNDEARPVIGTRVMPASWLDSKHVFRLAQHESGPARRVGCMPVGAIYLLEYSNAEAGSRVWAEAVPGFVAVAQLNSNSWLETREAMNERLQINLESAAAVASLIGVRRLYRPRSFDCLGHLVDLVERDIDAA